MTKRQITDKIPFKLLAVFLLLAAGICAGGFVFYQQQRARSVAHIQEDLNIVAQLKCNEITAWRGERYGDAYVISQSAIFIGMVKKWLGRPADAVLRQQIYVRLETFKVFGAYEGIYLTDAAGRIRLFTSKEIIGKLGASSLELIKLAADSNKIIFSDFYHCPECGHDHLDVFTPLFQGKDYIGCLIFRINPHVFLYPLIQTWPGESKTAETLLLHLHRQENQVHILNEPRHVQKKDIHEMLSTADTMRVEIEASQGKTGLFEGLDYRGIPVVADVRPISGSPWYMVAKVDKKEIYAPLRHQAISTALIIFLLLGTAGLSVGAMWQAERRDHYKKQYQLELERRALVKHYDYLTKYANDIIFLLDQDRRIVEINERGLETYGYAKEELLGREAGIIRAEEQRENFRTQMEEIKAKGALLYETMHRKKDGSTFPVEISARTIEIEGKRYTQTIIRDITERKQYELRIQDRNEELEAINQELVAAEEELRNQMEGLQRSKEEITNEKIWSDTLIQSAPNMVIGLGEGSKILLFNNYAEKLTGYKADEVLGKNWIDLFIPEEQRKQIYGVWDEIIKNKHIEHQYENPVLTKNKETRLISWRNSFLTENGQFKMVLSLGQDITERKLAEELIKQAAQKWSVTFDAITDGVAILDREQNLLQVNLNFSRLLGRPYSEIIGHKCYELLHADGKPDENCPFDKMLKSRKREAMELTIGDAIFNVIVDPIIDPSGEVTGAVQIISDITERKQYEMRIQDRNEELEAINQELTASEEELKAAEEELKHNMEELQASQIRFAELFMGINNGVAVYRAMEDGADFIFEDFNQAGLRMEHKTRDQVIGKRVTEAFPGVKEMGLFEVFQRVWRTGTPEHHPISIYKDDRLEGWRENYIYKLPSGEVVAVYDDLTALKQAEQKIAASEIRYRRLFESAKDGILILNADTGIIKDANPFIKELLEYPREELIGKELWEIGLFKDIAASKEDFIVLKKSVHVRYEGLPLQTREGRKINVEFISNVYSVGDHNVVQCNIRDITQRVQAEEQIRASLKEKEVLLKEIHHRVKNNLQIIASLLNLQTGYVQDERYKKMFMESQNRVRSMALVHETLYKSKDLSGIDFSHYVKSLMYDLYQAYGVTQGQVALSLDITGEKLPLDIAIPCGLIVNELATNSFKYAFKDRKGPGRMDISLNRDDAGTYTLEVSDNGPGISQDLNLKTAPTLGLQLVDSLVGQLDASIRITGEGGTRVTIKFHIETPQNKF